MDRNELIRHNLRLVHACAHRFEGKGIEYDDLFSAGCVGLVKAADRFDEEKGFRFSTYAVPVILGEIRQLFRSGGSIKISRSLQELSIRAKKICEAYRKEHDGEITITALAEKLGVDAYQAAQALNASRAVLSLSYDDGDNDTDPKALVSDIPVPSHEETLTERMALKQALNALADDDRDLIAMRYFQHKTQQQTADQLGTTQVQISRREKKILIKMRMMLI
ncbi:MAG: sigma-70 family RNA polymerase sigma factor [Ruminococcus sp.]|uniref:sigma-70 family RNA polymerase sigma factor n=1 Tax=Ruminococcus sp. TaxID=41978 RepID=UPI0028731C5C|nr:sigma-70 family RNA polymerase sigma factor [Ruminococcus sp.]MBQ3285126.1 sigma-70 family RNA polymerase sigma factor [Ruminococcus sp.]